MTYRSFCRTASFAPDGSLVYSPSPLSVTYGSRGDTIIVNGAVGPVAKVPRGLVRLRILDGANARNFYLRFSDRRTFHVIASDSGMLAGQSRLGNLESRPASVSKSSSTSRITGR